MNIYEKLLYVQTHLKAPKNRKNTFGGYSYRSCEDILEAVKPLLAEVKATIRLNDAIANIGDRYYVEAEAKLIDIETDNNNFIWATAFAREQDEKKGMDAAQLTGTASSYARKYALNALLLIDDVKDPDSDEFKTEAEKKEKKAKPKTDATVLDKYVTDAQLKTLERLLERAEVTAEKFNKIYGLALLSELPSDKYDDAVQKLETAIKVKEKGE